MARQKKGEGHPLPDTPAMKAWRKEFEELSLEDHLATLKNMGMDQEDLDEFRAHWEATHKKEKK